MVSTHTRGYLFVLPWELDHGGGVNQVILNLWREMARDGRVHPLLMVNSWENPRPSISESAGKTVVHFRLRGLWGGGDDRKHLLAYLACLPVTLLRLRRLVRHFDIAVVNFHFPHTSALSFLLLRWIGAFKGRIVLSFHGADVRGALVSRGVERLIWHLLLRYADARIAVSRSLRDEVCALSPGADVAVIHNGIDIAGFLAEQDPASMLDPRLRDRPFILCIAAFDPWKGQDLVVGAFAGIAADFPELMLVFVGKRGSYAGRVRQEAAHFALQDRIVICEEVPHSGVGAFLGRARLFVLASRKEPFGIVLLEAGAYGLPVVATAVGGIPEIITDGETGKLVRAEDVAALRQAMADLLRAPEAGRAMGERLRRHVAATFSWRKACDEYLRLAFPSER